MRAPSTFAAEPNDAIMPIIVDCTSGVEAHLLSTIGISRQQGCGGGQKNMYLRCGPKSLGEKGEEESLGDGIPQAKDED